MSGVREERDALITDHLRLCSRAARKFARRTVERVDLEQVAAVGLIKAADRFNPERGVPFAAYAWKLILGELMHYVRDDERVLRAPRRLREAERLWNATERELWVTLNREPTDREIANRLGLSERERVEIGGYRLYGAAVSLESLKPHDQRLLSYTIDQQDERLMLEAGLSRLSQLERTVLHEIYERDTPIVEVAKRLGYSRRHITRLHRAALQKLA